MTIDNSNILLSDRQVYEVKRIDDNAHIGVYYTAQDAQEVAEEYEARFNEACRIAYSYISGEETIGQRKLNEQIYYD